MNDLIEKFSKTPTKQKLLGLIALSAIFGLIFYFMFYSDQADSADRLGQQIKQQQQEKLSYQDKQRNYNSFRAEVTKLLEEQKELIKVLPTDAEIPSFLQSIHAQGELAGLSILTFEQGGEDRKAFYASIPVRISISGTYFQINKFFYSIGQLKRIVNIQNLTLSNPWASEQGVMLQANFIASTFRFIAPPEAPPPPPRG